MLTQIFRSINAFLANIGEFQSRIWVVHIIESRLKDESFIVNEDSFTTELEWMKRKNYTPEMLAEVEAMKPSQIRIFHIGQIEHQLMRVK
jgi:hypothetical protein